MYQQHFKLLSRPFSLTPDPDFYYVSESQQRALNTLIIALRQGDGFVKICGEVGTGKTLLSRKFISMLADDYTVAHIFNAYLTPNELKLMLAQELGILLNQSVPSYRILLHIQKRLVQLAKADKKVVLVIDEAQAMPRDTLETLRLLSNLETNKRKLIQVVLLGQPELDEVLARHDLRQLKQRIVYEETITQMDRSDTLGYINRRLTGAGGDQQLFSTAAKQLLHNASRGNPRLVNILAHKMLMSSFARGDVKVGIRDLFKAVAASKSAISSTAKHAGGFRFPYALAACGLLAVPLATAVFFGAGL